MNEKQFSDRIGNVNDKLVQQAEQTPNYGREHRKRGVRQLVAIDGLQLHSGRTGLCQRNHCGGAS